jgi:hypothetical protein
MKTAISDRNKEQVVAQNDVYLLKYQLANRKKSLGLDRAQVKDMKNDLTAMKISAYLHNDDKRITFITHGKGFKTFQLESMASKVGLGLVSKLLTGNISFAVSENENSYDLFPTFNNQKAVLGQKGNLAVLKY